MIRQEYISIFKDALKKSGSNYFHGEILSDAILSLISQAGYRIFSNRQYHLITCLYKQVNIQKRLSRKQLEILVSLLEKEEDIDFLFCSDKEFFYDYLKFVYRECKNKDDKQFIQFCFKIAENHTDSQSERIFDYLYELLIEKFPNEKTLIEQEHGIYIKRCYDGWK